MLRYKIAFSRPFTNLCQFLFRRWFNQENPVNPCSPALVDRPTFPYRRKTTMADEHKENVEIKSDVRIEADLEGSSDEKKGGTANAESPVPEAAQEKSPEGERVEAQSPKSASPRSDESDVYYTTLDDIPLFSDWVKQNMHKLTKPTDAPYEVNPEINEKISIYTGDITELQIDAIVNAANKSLLGGGGVDGAIHKAAGPELKKKCRELNGCKTGDAKITRGFQLPARAVIHTVGPMGRKPELLANCYNNSLNLAVYFKLRSIAFPCISTGIYGYPNSDASHVVLETVRTWLEKEEHFKLVDRIIFCLFMHVDKEAYNASILRYFPVEQFVDSPGTSPMNTLAKLPIKTPEKSPIEETEKSSIKTPEKSPIEETEKSSIKTPEKSPIAKYEISPIKTPEKSPIKTPEKSLIETSAKNLEFESMESGSSPISSLEPAPKQPRTSPRSSPVSDKDHAQ